MQDLLETCVNNDRTEWNNKFFSDKSIRKINFYGTKEYYARFLGNRIIELYSIGENERIIREPLSTLLIFPMAIPRRDFDGFDMFGEHYSRELIQRDEEEVIKFENL